MLVHEYLNLLMQVTLVQEMEILEDEESNIKVSL